MQMTLDKHAEFNRYAQRNMDAALRPVDDRLLDWGRFAREYRLPMDWSETTWLSRVIEQGPSGAAQQTQAPIVIPPDILAVDRAVAKLRGIYRAIIRVRYVYHPGQPVEVQRRKLNMSEARWKSKLFTARELIAHELGLVLEGSV